MYPSKQSPCFESKYDVGPMANLLLTLLSSFLNDLEDYWGSSHFTGVNVRCDKYQLTVCVYLDQRGSFPIAEH